MNTLIQSVWSFLEWLVCDPANRRLYMAIGFLLFMMAFFRMSEIIDTKVREWWQNRRTKP